MLCRKVIFGFAFIFLLFPMEIFAAKHVFIAYDISKSMKVHVDADDIKRIHHYLNEILFDGLPKVLKGDKFILLEKNEWLCEGIPLLRKGDRVSFVRFGDPPIPKPLFVHIYDETPSLWKELLKYLPKDEREFIDRLTCIELLHWRAAQVFKEHPGFEYHLLVLISDLCESHYPFSAEEQRKILWYKNKCDKEIFCDIQVGGAHIEVSRIILPRTGIEILDPRPGEQPYYGGKPFLVRVNLLKDGEIIKEKEWKVLATIIPKNRPSKKIEAFLNDEGLGKDEEEGDGIYTGVLSPGKGEWKFVVLASKGPIELQTPPLKMFLSPLPGPPIWFIVAAIILLGLFIQYRLWPIKVWVEREGYPPRRVELKRVGDVVFLGKKEGERYLDMGLPRYSFLRQKRKEIVLWCEGKDEGEVIPWDRWFSPEGEEGISLRFSLKGPEKKGKRPEPPRKVTKEGDFYKW